MTWTLCGAAIHRRPKQSIRSGVPTTKTNRRTGCAPTAIHTLKNRSGNNLAMIPLLSQSKNQTLGKREPNVRVRVPHAVESVKGNRVRTRSTIRGNQLIAVDGVGWRGDRVGSGIQIKTDQLHSVLSA